MRVVPVNSEQEALDPFDTWAAPSTKLRATASSGQALLRTQVDRRAVKA